MESLPSYRTVPNASACRVEAAGDTAPPVGWETWTPVDQAVLCFVRRGNCILLIHKKRGLGRGKINGPGGRIEPGESAKNAAIRETREEVGITPVDPIGYARLRFQFTDGYSLSCEVFVAHETHGDLIETEEARPFWCPVTEIPYHRMWADDRHWLPHVLGGKYVDAYFVFDGDWMLSRHVKAWSPSIL